MLKNGLTIIPGVRVLTCRRWQIPPRWRNSGGSGFQQPRALSKTVSDEWTVPLCRTHHRALHDVGDEAAWWKQHGIDAAAEAQKLWRQTHSSLQTGTAA